MKNILDKIIDYKRVEVAERAAEHAGAVWGPVLALALVSTTDVRTAILLSIVLTFFGAAAGYRVGLHMRVTFVRDRLPHVWPVFVTLLPEARDAFTTVARFARETGGRKAA